MACPAWLKIENNAGNVVFWKHHILSYRMSGGETEEEKESLGDNIFGLPIYLGSVQTTPKRFISWSIEVLVTPAQIVTFKAIAAHEDTIWTLTDKADPSNRTTGLVHSVKCSSWNVEPNGFLWKLSLELTNDISDDETTVTCSFSIGGLIIPCSRITEWSRTKAEYFNVERSIFGKQTLFGTLYRYPYLWQIGFIAKNQEAASIRQSELTQEGGLLNSGDTWLQFNDNVEPSTYTCSVIMKDLKVSPIKVGAYQVTLSALEVFP